MIKIRKTLLLISTQINCGLELRTKETGITPLQSGVMERIDRSPGISQAELIRETGSTKQYISQTINCLEGLGLVQSEVSPSDNRVRQLYLTELGQKRQAAWRDTSYRRLGERLERLSDEERECVLAAVRILHRRLPELTREGLTLF